MLSMSMSYLMDQSPNCPLWRLQFPCLFTKTHIFLCLVIDPTLPSKNMESRKNSEDSHLWNAMFHIHVAWWKVPIVFSQLLQFFIRPLASPELPLWLQLVNTHPINPGRSVCLKVWDIRFINQSLQICIYIYIIIYIYIYIVNGHHLFHISRSNNVKCTPNIWPANIDVSNHGKEWGSQFWDNSK